METEAYLVLDHRSPEISIISDVDQEKLRLWEVLTVDDEKMVQDVDDLTDIGPLGVFLLERSDLGFIRTDEDGEILPDKYEFSVLDESKKPESIAVSSEPGYLLCRLTYIDAKKVLLTRLPVKSVAEIFEKHQTDDAEFKSDLDTVIEKKNIWELGDSLEKFILGRTINGLWGYAEKNNKMDELYGAMEKIYGSNYAKEMDSLTALESYVSTMLDELDKPGEGEWRAVCLVRHIDELWQIESNPEDKEKVLGIVRRIAEKTVCGPEIWWQVVKPVYKDLVEIGKMSEDEAMDAVGGDAMPINVLEAPGLAKKNLPDSDEQGD